MESNIPKYCRVTRPISATHHFKAVGLLVPLFPPVAFGRYHRVHSRFPGGGYDFIGVIGFSLRLLLVS